MALPSSSISVAAETCTVVPETIQSPIGAVLGRLSMTPWNWSSSEPPPPLLACAAAVGTSAIIRVTAMPANVMRRSNPLTSMVVWCIDPYLNTDRPKGSPPHG